MDPTSPRTTLRPRFGLKVVFAAMTALAIGAGYWTAAWRASTEIARRHNAVVDQLIDNLATPPRGTTLPLTQTRAQLELYMRGQFGTGIPTRAMAAQVLGRKQMSFSSMATVQLKVSQPAGPDSLVLLVERLREHYASGLGECGLQCQGRRGGPADGRAKMNEILASQSHDLVVIIDVEAVDTGAAEVRVIFLDSQTLDVW